MRHSQHKIRKIPISIHALHEESDHSNTRKPRNNGNISIHALHEESDHACRRSPRNSHISIHALHEESDGRNAGNHQ